MFIVKISPETVDNIYNIPISALQESLINEGFPKFRIKQILPWLYVHDVQNFNEMKNIGAKLTNWLTNNYFIDNTSLKDVQQSCDGSTKFLLGFKDNIQVECVGMPSENKLTVCLSTQAGCPMGCVFCATGNNGFKRNLGYGHILKQLTFIQKQYDKRISNIVLMGQGEPFLNFQNVVDFLQISNNKDYLNIGARHITISTCGIPDKIIEFSKLNKQYVLAVSLHSAIQSKRDYLMPGLKKYSLDKLKEALFIYQQNTNRRITFEYIMVGDFNDKEEDFKALIDFCNGLHCHINLIPLNKTDLFDKEPSSQDIINQWIYKLKASGIEASARYSKGQDINAACGQLSNKH